MRSFERLARIRAIWERQARTRLGSANREVGVRETARADAAGALDRLRGTPIEAPDPARLELARLQGIASQDLLADATASLRRAEEAARAAQGNWRRTAQDLEIAERLEAERQRVRAYLARRAAEKGLDEIAALRRTEGSR
jgi:hypothetical protein